MNRITKIKDQIEKLQYPQKDIRTLQALEKLIDVLPKINIDDLEKFVDKYVY